MAEVTWFKVLTDIFSDDKIKILQSMPEGDSLLVMWFKVLAQAGKTNDGGYIYLKKNIPYTFGMFATLFGKQQQLVELAMRTFSEFGMIDIDDSGYVFVTNWEKHQSIDKLNQIKEKANTRLKKHRDKKRIELLESNVSETFPKRTSNATEIDIELDIEKDTTTTTAEAYVTVGEIHLKVFKSFSMTGLMTDYIMKLTNMGYQDIFVKELMLETGEAGTSPSLRLMQTIGERWMKDGIYTRLEAKTRKDVDRIKIVPDRPKKSDPELESRNIEIARSRWIQGGGDPSEFRYNTPTGA